MNQSIISHNGSMAQVPMRLSNNMCNFMKKNWWYDISNNTRTWYCLLLPLAIFDLQCSSLRLFICKYWSLKKKGVPSAESSCSVRGLGKGVSGKPYPRLCNARRPRLEPGTFRSQAVRLYRLHQARPSALKYQEKKVTELHLFYLYKYHNTKVLVNLGLQFLRVLS